MAWNRRDFLGLFACLGLSLAMGRVLAVTSSRTEKLPCWSYHGDMGPDQWGHLHPDWGVCAEGFEQSPIALPGGEAEPTAERFALHYQATAGRLNGNTHTVQVDMAPGCWLLFSGQDFPLRQFHFHTPSEHLWSDTVDAGEIHLVHVADSGEIAVLGVALRPDAAQAFPTSFWSWLQAAGTGEAVMLNPADLVPRQSRFLSYRGSLTIPPCTEGVRWLLATEPIAVGSGERRWLEQQMGQNARPVQSLGSRTVHSVQREGS